MTILDILVYMLKFFIPSVFAVIFRIVGMGYRSKKRIYIGIVSYCLYLFVIPFFLISYLGYGEFTHIASPVMLLGTILSVLIISNDSFGKTVFIHLAQANAVTVIMLLISLLRRLLNFSYETQLLILLIVCPVVCAVGLRYWAKPLRFIVDNLHGNMIFYLLLPLVTQGIIAISPVYLQMFFYHYPVYSTMMMLAAEVVFFLYIYNLYRSLLEIQRLSKQDLKYQLLQSEISTYQEYLQRAKESRHDQRHHNMLLLEYLDRGDLERVRQYLCQQNMDLEQDALEIYCDHPAVSAVLRIYDKKAQNSGVSYGVRVDISKTLPFSDTEITVLFSNMLENALISCQKIESGKKSILLTVEQDEYSLKIQLCNSVSEKVCFNEQELPLSKNQNGGTGVRSMQAMVKRHGGMLRFSQQGEEFITQIKLPLI